jgi:hypothetical protein
MGAQIGPRVDADLYEVPSSDLVKQVTQQVTGIRPEAASGHAFLKEAGFKSIQRLMLADANGGIVAGLCPGELMRDAQFLYSEHRAEVFVSAAEAGGWLVRPTPHIGFWQSPARQRLYLDPTLALGQYVELWEGPGWGRFGGYSLEDLKRSVWPWLKGQGLATDADDPVLDEFLVLLTSLRRQAHLRAGLYAKREWSREEIAGWPTSQVASEVRAEFNRVLQPIGEPKLPAG